MYLYSMLKEVRKMEQNMLVCSSSVELEIALGYYVCTNVKNVVVLFSANVIAFFVFLFAFTTCFVQFDAALVIIGYSISTQTF